MANSTTRKESSNGSGITEKFQHMASGAMEKVQDFSEEATKKAKEVSQKLPETIRHYPLQSLAVGFGVGFLSAMIVKKII